MNTSSLATFLNSMEKKGLLNTAANETIQNFLDYRIKSTGKIYLTYAALMGALFISAGIVLFFEEFWADMPKHVRGVLSCMPFVAGVFFYFQALTKYPNSTSFKEAASVFYMLMIGATMYLLSQTYAIEENVDLFVAIWLIAGLKILYIYRSVGAAFIYLILICRFIYPSITMTFIIPSGYAVNEKFYLFWIFFIGILPHLYLTLNRISDRQGLRAIVLGWLISILLVLSLPLAFTAGHLWWGLAIIIGFYIIGKKYYGGNLSALGRPFQTTALFLIFYDLMLVSDDFTRTQLFSKDGLETMGSWRVLDIASYFTGCATLLTLTIVALVMARKNASFNRYVIYTPFLFLLLIGTYYLDVVLPTNITGRDWITFNWLSFFILNLYVLGFGISAMMKGNRSKSVLYMFYGLAMVANLMWARYADMDLTFWLKGLFFIGVGFVFFIIHYLSVDDFEGES